MITLGACLVTAANDEPEINLRVGKERVLPNELRTSVLEVAGASLNRSDEAFLATIKKIENPYPGEEEATKTAVDPSEGVLEVYDDTSVLELIQANFAPQVRGTLAKGNVYYLQLNGGGMLEEGTSFPVQIPQIEGESFTVTVLEITPDGYKLKMNDVVRDVTFDKSSGTIRKTQ